jgi:hypothetical protein
MSDHTPLLLQGELEHYRNPSFRFENFSVHVDGFKEMVQQIWERPVHSVMPLKRLNTKLARVAKGIKRWRKEKIGDTRLQLAIVKEVLLQLEATQETRTLTPEEIDLRRQLKARSTRLAAIEKARIRQQSRLAHIRNGDANTKFFHIRASTRLRKNYIHRLHADGGMAITHIDKEKAVAEYFSDHLSSVAPRTTSFDWNALGYMPRDLSMLEAPFTQEKIKDTVDSMSSDKAPGLDGFTGAFFKTCWEIIKGDITAALNSMFMLNSQGFELLNSANIILLPKKADAMQVTDFRLISLIHSIAKLFAKLLANRLAPLLDSLVSKC